MIEIKTIKSSKASIGFAVFAGVLAAFSVQLSVGAASYGPRWERSEPAAYMTPPQEQQQRERRKDIEADIESRDLEQNGIEVSQPKVYDDALLHQMLRAAEARLASLQVIDQTSIAARLGAVSGASQQNSGFALNVQGPAVPGVTTGTKLPTESTTVGSQTTAAGATSTSQSVVSNLGTEDVTTTRPSFSPPAATAPAPTVNFPTGFSVSSSDILNEQMQLSAEINGLRLLLAGSLSDYFTDSSDPDDSSDALLPKLKTTLGFHIAVTPDRRYKDAVAIVEVEVRALQPITPGDRPAVTAILPREKTYNVAAIRDKSTSIGGGVATQIVGVSGSFITGRKTYYLVQDQDTVALTYRPAEYAKTGFRWQFRPVLGQHYVKSGLKQTFVQLAFPTTQAARRGEIGKVTVSTYWRKYDSKSGIVKGIVPGSYQLRYSEFDIPSFRQPVMPTGFNAATGLEDLGGGQMLVKLTGRFLPGTYVRIGATPLTEGPRFKQEHNGIKFIAPIADLATKGAFLVAHDGREKKLEISSTVCPRFSIDRDPKITPVDEANSRVEVQVTCRQMDRGATLPRHVIVVGQRVFGYSDAPVSRDIVTQTTNANNTVDRVIRLTAVVPDALLMANRELAVQALFAPGDYRKTRSLASLQPANQTERLVVLEKGSPVKFLLYGNNLGPVRILSPSGVLPPENIGTAEAPLFTLYLTAEQMKSNKQLLIQRAGGQPYLLAIPEVEVKKADPPKARDRVTMNADEAIIDNVGLKDVESANFRDVPIIVEAEDDKSVRLRGLRAAGVTSEVAVRKINLKLKAAEKPVKVDLEVISSRVEYWPK